MPYDGNCKTQKPKKVLDIHLTLFLARGWGLGMRTTCVHGAETDAMAGQRNSVVSINYNFDKHSATWLWGK